MANSIALADKYLPIIDEVYAKESTSAVLESPDFVRNFDGANAVKIMSIATQGLGDYSRNSGYVDGDITVTWETHTLSEDRGRRFVLDAMDNDETLGQSLGASMREFMRVDVTAEIDAYRFATLAGLGGTTVSADLTSGTAKTAVDTAIVAMKENEVPLEGGFLFVTPTILNAIEGSSQFTYNVNAEVASPRDGRIVGSYKGLQIVEVPQSRFYTSIDLNDGTTGGQEAGGYVKTPTTGRDLNFLIVARNAALPVVKHNPSNVINPDDNQTADGWIMKYRIYHDIFVPANKTDGIYVHHKTS